MDALRHDLPELPELDNLFAPEVCRYSILTRAQLLGGLKHQAISRGGGDEEREIQYLRDFDAAETSSLLYRGACLVVNLPVAVIFLFR